MKVVAFNGSPRKEGNTAQAIQIVFEELHAAGIETELVQLGGRKVFGCLACQRCMENKDNRCVRDDDEMNTFIAKMIEADGIIIGSPTYFSNVSAEVKALIDRCGYVNKANGGMILRGKIGSGVVSVRRAGANFVYSAINFFFGISEMIIPGSSYWNMTLSLKPGDVQNDPEGIATFRTLGRNMADLLKKPDSAVLFYFPALIIAQRGGKVMNKKEKLGDKRSVRKQSSREESIREKNTENILDDTGVNAPANYFSDKNYEEDV